MSEDGATRDPKRASIPAPATVPRPSRPPTALERDGALPPASARKGTLDGLSPQPTGFAYAAEPTTEEFDVERTVVVDPHDHDDAPTADYDPRAIAAYDPRARGVFPPAEPRTRADTAPSGAASDPRASEAGRKRSSRRTVKMTPGGSVRPAPPEADAASPELTPRMPEVVAHAANGPVVEVDAPGAAMPRAEGEAPPRSNDYTEFAEYSDAIADEITIVRALRIINVGSEPPPPISSPEVTWPPPGDPSDFDTGWTPIAPPVAELPRDLVAQQPELAALSPAAHSAPATERQPSAPDILVTEDTPLPDVRPETPTATLDAPLAEARADTPETVVEDDRDLIEDIEPDSMPLPDARPAEAPKKPPPPPPKAKSDTKAVTEAPRKGKPWWEDIFSEEYLRTHDAPDELTVQREVNFIEESLGMEKHAVVLDLACGAGDHTIEFALRGYNVVGFDYSAGQLALAEKRLQKRTRGMAQPSVPTFVQGDMRELPYEEAFDGVYCWATSFGYFDDEKNLAVLQSVHRSLKQGGMFLLDVVNRDHVAPRAPGLVWFEGDRCVCMDDTYLDFFTSRLRVKRTAMFEGGLSRELDYSIRLYTLHELGKLLHEAGFKVIEVTGHIVHPGVFFGSESPRIMILAERA